MFRLVALLILLFPIALHAQSFQVTSSTSLRVKPDSKSEVILRVRSGDQGKVIDSKKWWTEVVFKGYKGFIKTAKLKFINNTPPNNKSSKYSNPEFGKSKIESVKNNSTEAGDNINDTQKTIEKLYSELEKARLDKAKISKELHKTKLELRLKEEQFLSAELENELIQRDLKSTEKKLKAVETEKLYTQRELDIARISNHPKEASIFKSMVDVTVGGSMFVEDNHQEAANGINVEAKYSFSSAKGFGFEGGLNMINLFESNKFAPFLNPFLGVSYGVHENKIGFSFAPRVYLFSNPSLKMEERTETVSTTTTLTPSVMFGFGANLKFKISKKTALTLSGSFMRGTQKLKETGTRSGVIYNNTTKNNLNIYSAGIGLSFKL